MTMSANPCQQAERRLIRFNDVAARVGLARTAIYARIKDGSFPAPVKVGRGSRWVDEEIGAWVARQIEEHRGVTKRPKRRKNTVAP